MNTTRFQKQVALVLIGVLLAACGGSEPPTAGEPVALANACDKANEGKRIAVEGHIMVPEKSTGDFSVVLRIRNQPDRSETPGAAVSMRIDKDKKLPNTMNMLPSTYQEEDLIFRTASGETLGYLDKVRISGKMYFPSSVASVDFVCGLENPYIEKAG